MNALYIIGMVLEIWAVMFLIWGAFHEGLLIRAEKRIAAGARRWWRGMKCRICRRLADDGIYAVVRFR